LVLKVKGKVLPLLTKYHAIEDVQGSGGIAPHILNFRTRCCVCYC